MEYLWIEGGQPISGRLRPAGNKNAALPVLAATLLTEEPVRLRNLPAIRDVEVMLQILEHLGAEVRRLGPHEVEIRGRAIHRRFVPRALASQIRASVLVAGPLLAREGEVELAPPGGDVIGRRRLDTHLLAFQALGAHAEVNRTLTLRAPQGLRGAEIFMDEASVTGTENAIMAAVLAEGETVIHNAASEPHVQELCRLLNRMGAKIEGIGTNTLRIQGVPSLGGTEHEIGPDYIEAGSWIALAAVTGGDLWLEGVRPWELRMTRLVFGRLGVVWEEGEDWIHVPPDQPLEIQPDLGGAIPKVDDGPWPAFPADLMSIALVLATQSRGTVLFFEKMFESRLYFVDKLISMGAQIILCDPHRAVVIGPSRLRGEELESPDIRAGMALLIAALCAEGESVIRNVRQIDRGYERIDERLRALGARVERRREDG